jgi:hypothetical protein
MKMRRKLAVMALNQLKLAPKARNFDQVATTIPSKPELFSMANGQIGAYPPSDTLTAQVMLGFLADAIGIVAAS